jgi:hypothetical protein
MASSAKPAAFNPAEAAGSLSALAYARLREWILDRKISAGSTLLEGRIAWGHLAACFALNLVWLTAMGALFLGQFRAARVRGALMNIGE